MGEGLNTPQRHWCGTNFLTTLEVSAVTPEKEENDDEVLPRQVHAEWRRKIYRAPRFRKPILGARNFDEQTLIVIINTVILRSFWRCTESSVPMNLKNLVFPKYRSLLVRFQACFVLSISQRQLNDQPQIGDILDGISFNEVTRDDQTMLMTRRAA